jgi:hypothetical protein
MACGPSCITQTPPDPNRQTQARTRRNQITTLEDLPIPTHVNNCEESDYGRAAAGSSNGSYIFNFSKSLVHDTLGDPDPTSYETLLHALATRQHTDFEHIQQAAGAQLKLTDPEAGLAFVNEGPDPEALAQCPAPRNDRPRAAAEAGELYWMALARDVAFINYASLGTDPNSVIGRAASSLTSPQIDPRGEFTEFFGPKDPSRRVTPQLLFRGIYPGETVGPYVSQFLLKGTADPLAPAGQGKNARDGFIMYGAQKLDQRIEVAVPGKDYLTARATWLAAQNGTDYRGQDQIDPTRRFIRSLRDLTTYVHFDQVINAWYNATWILMQQPRGDQLAADPGAVPGRDMEFEYDQGNPFDPAGPAASPTQRGFVEFGPLHVLAAVTEVINRAGAAVWYQKWFVHRRLRPEELGGRIDNHLNRRRYYPIHYQILQSLRYGLLSNYFPGTFGSYLLPQAYPEGCPTHPSYGAGHATISGACATILKAFFNDDQVIENPLQAAADGLSLVDYTGADRTCMTLGGELNKLAGNIALARNAAGVHWRTDYDRSLLLGEQVAVRLLREYSLLYNPPNAFYLTLFSGRRAKIANGQIWVSTYYYGPSPRCLRFYRYSSPQLATCCDSTVRGVYAGSPTDPAASNQDWVTQQSSTSPATGTTATAASTSTTGTADATATTTTAEPPTYPAQPDADATVDTTLDDTVNTDPAPESQTFTVASQEDDASAYLASTSGTTV